MEMMRCGRMERCGGNNVQPVGYSGNNTCYLLELEPSRLTKMIIIIRRSACLEHRNPMISFFFISHVISAWHFFLKIFFLISSSFTVIQLTAIQSSICALCHSRPHPIISRKMYQNARTKGNPNESTCRLVIDGIKYRNDLGHFLIETG